MCYTLKIVKDIASIVASLGVIGALWAAWYAYKNYKINSSIKRMQFIDQVYKIFDDDEDIRKLHDLLVEDPELKIPINSPEEPALIKALTLFDRICNYYEQEIINNDSLSYIAAEILDFYNHKGVSDYIEESYKYYEYDKKGYKDPIRFYSGLKDLGQTCSKQFIRADRQDKRA